MNVRTVTYTYDGPWRTFHKTVPCAGVCGRKLRRQKTIQHTVNPFNKNADGTVKTWAEVERDVINEGKAWIAQPETCMSCRDELGIL
jgi:hypothetical protein